MIGRAAARAGEADCVREALRLAKSANQSQQGIDLETSVAKNLRFVGRVRRIPGFAASAAIALASTGAGAQNAPTTPNIKMVDENFVEMPSDFVSADVHQFSIGSGVGKLTQSIKNWSTDSPAPVASIPASGFYPGSPFETDYTGGIIMSLGNDGTPSCSLVFKFADISERFTCDTTTGVPLQSLDQKGGSFPTITSTSWVYVDRFGAKYFIDKTINGPTSDYSWPVTEVDYPDGRILKVYYKNAPGSYSNAPRIQGIENNLGYFIKYEYKSDVPTQSDSADWAWISKAYGGNHAYDVCDVSADHCTLSTSKTASVNWPSDFSYIDILNAAGETSHYTLDSYHEITSYTPPDQTSPEVTYTMCARGAGLCSWTMSDVGTNLWYAAWVQGGTYMYPGKVYTAVSHGETTNYEPSNSCNCGGYIAATTFSNDYRGVRQLAIYAPPQSLRPYIAGSLDSYMDEKGEQFTYAGDATNHLTSFTDATGVSTGFTYDSRSNITSQIVGPTDGSSSAVTTAAYPATCTNVVTCNKPTSVTDPKGGETDFTYDPVHGGILTETRPADPNGVRPQKRYTYVQRYAVYYNTAGVLTQAATPIWLVASESYCRTSSWTGTVCAAGSSDEVVTSYDYGPTTGANNLLLRGEAVVASGQTRRTCYSYNAFGDRVSETSPNANLGSCP